MRSVFFSAMLVLAVFTATVANADLIGTYVDATLSNTAPSSAIRTDANLDTDNEWYLYQGRAFGQSGTIINSNGGADEDCPMLTTSVSGVANGVYDVYAIFWTNRDQPHSDPNWSIKAAISGGSLTTFDVSNSSATGYQVEEAPGAYWYERQAYLGQVNVTSGSITVNIDDVQAVGVDCRTWYDGISYQAVPEPSAFALLAMGLFSLLAYAWKKRK